MAQNCPSVVLLSGANPGVYSHAWIGIPKTGPIPGEAMAFSQGRVSPFPQLRLESYGQTASWHWLVQSGSSTIPEERR